MGIDNFMNWRGSTVKELSSRLSIPGHSRKAMVGVGFRRIYDASLPKKYYIPGVGVVVHLNSECSEALIEIRVSKNPSIGGDFIDASEFLPLAHDFDNFVLPIDRLPTSIRSMNGHNLLRVPVPQTWTSSVGDMSGSLLEETVYILGRRMLMMHLFPMVRTPKAADLVFQSLADFYDCKGGVKSTDQYVARRRCIERIESLKADMSNLNANLEKICEDAASAMNELMDRFGFEVELT